MSVNISVYILNDFTNFGVSVVPAGRVSSEKRIPNVRRAVVKFSGLITIAFHPRALRIRDSQVVTWSQVKLALDETLQKSRM